MYLGSVWFIDAKIHLFFLSVVQYILVVREFVFYVLQRNQNFLKKCFLL